MTETPGVERITVAITREMAHMVKGVVQSGDYASASEVVRDALRLWKEHQKAREREVMELRRLWQEAEDSGAAEDGTAVFERLRNRYDRRGETG